MDLPENVGIGHRFDETQFVAPPERAPAVQPAGPQTVAESDTLEIF